MPSSGSPASILPGPSARFVSFSPTSAVIAQYWHARFDADPGNRWLRSAFARLYAAVTD